jgi:hypothetical protein
MRVRMRGHFELCSINYSDYYALRRGHISVRCNFDLELCMQKYFEPCSLLSSRLSEPGGMLLSDTEDLTDQISDLVPSFASPKVDLMLSFYQEQGGTRQKSF